MSLVLNHLWQSTLFAAAVALLTWALRRYAASIRFWLWTSASLKFLVPFAWLAMAGSYLPWQTVTVERLPSPRTFTQIVEPFVPAHETSPQLSPLRESSAESFAETWERSLFCLWLLGLVSVVGRRLRQSWRLARMRDAARPADGEMASLPFPVLVADAGVEPGVFGILRPVLFLPAGITDRLSREQFAVVIAHERVHIRRRDNLWAALHGTVQAIFWFHPLVWWMGRRLVAERELACDEAVLAEGADAENYAAAILTVCRYYACASPASVAGVTGADLKQRIAAIMRFDSRRESLPVRFGLVALAATAIVIPILLGRAWGQPSASSPLNFEVASLREFGPGEGPSDSFVAGVQFSTGRVRSQCVSLRGLVFYAYQLTGTEPIHGLPKWADASCGHPDSAGAFTVDARMPAATTNAESRQMMQALLAERFQLAAHWETRQLPTYALKTTPGKPKLKRSDPAQDPEVPAGSIGCPPDDPQCHIGFCCGSTTLASLTGLLSRQLGRPVVNKTGLTGSYYFGVLRWAGAQSAASSLPSLSALLRDDFGLELKSEPGPVPVLIIDRIEKPSAN